MSLLAQASTHWFLRLLGFDSSEVPSDSTVQFIWTGMPQSWGVFVLVGFVVLIAVGVGFFYLREIETCPRSVKFLLSGIRFVVLLLLLLMWLGPALVYTQTSVREPWIVVLRDASQSMNTADSYKYASAGTAETISQIVGRPVADVNEQGVKRTEVVNELMRRDNRQFVKKLQERGRVRIFDFSDASKPVESLPSRISGKSSATMDDGDEPGVSFPPATTVTPLTAEGRGTDIGRAIRDSLGIKPLSAIVLITDGQQTTPDRPQDAAQQAGDKEVPLLIVGIGDPSRPRNLKLEEIYVRPKVWPNEPFQIDVVVRADGIEARKQVALELTEQRISDTDGQPGAERVLERVNLTVPEGGGRIRQSFAHSVGSAGRFVYSARVARQDDEDPLDNELRSRVLDVVKENVKVLLVAGAPSWDYRMVQRLLRRDDTIDVSCWLQTLDPERPQEGDVTIERLPSTIQELGDYHVVMLFDPNPDEFDDNWMNLLKEFVGKRAGGLLYMAGPKYTGLFLSLKKTGGLRDMLPVRFGDAGEIEVARLGISNRQAWPLEIVLSSVDHPIMSFYKDIEESSGLWRSFPGVYWSFPTKQAKPTTRVLLEHGNETLPDAPRPLLVSGRYGAGNTVYMGFNGTWRWRRIGRQAEYFDRFWIQATRFLVETRSLQGRRRGYVEPERNKYEIGQKISVTAQLYDATYEPLTLDQVEATLQVGDADPSGLTFKPVAGQPGRYEATLSARQTGEHIVRIELAGSEGSEAVQLEPASFVVETPSAEIKQVWMDEALLKELATASGGKYYGVGEIDKLPDDISLKLEEVKIRSKPVLLWSLHRIPYIFLGVLVLLLTSEWALRKWFKLL